ncbi:MAG: hypothetical protein AAF409_18820 [Pseudomonadota bacterium]
MVRVSWLGAAVVALAMCAQASPVRADYCGDREAGTVFHCQLLGSSRQVTVCQHEDGSYQYAYGKPNRTPELELRRTKEAAVYTPWNGIGRAIWASLSLRNGNYLYEVSFSYDKFDQTEAGTLTVYIGEEIASQRSCRPDTLEQTLFDLEQDG